MKFAFGFNGFGFGGAGAPFPPSFDMASLFAAGETGGYWDLSNLATIFQDSGGTTPGAVGSPIGKLNPSAGSLAPVQGTAGSRPVLHQDENGRLYADFDGTDDFLSVAYALSAYPMTIMLAGRLDNGNGVMSLETTTSVYKAMILASTTSLGTQDRGGSNIIAQAAFVAGFNAVFLSEFTSSTTSAQVNGGPVGSQPNTNSFGTSVTLNMGRLRATGNYFTGRIYQALIINRLLTSGEKEGVAKMFNYKAAIAQSV